MTLVLAKAAHQHDHKEVHELTPTMTSRQSTDDHQLHHEMRLDCIATLGILACWL
jgi:hypothetical protein